MRKEIEMDELNKTAPELTKINKENPFRVPENYFDDFSARLQMRIEAEQTGGNVKQNAFIRYLKPAIGLAAGFALVFSLAYWPLKTLTPNQMAENNTTEINTGEILFASMVEGIDVNSFYQLLEDPSGTVQFSDEELVTIVNTNSSEFEIYTAAEIQ